MNFKKTLAPRETEFLFILHLTKTRLDETGRNRRNRGCSAQSRPHLLCGCVSIRGKSVSKQGLISFQAYASGKN